MKVNLIKFFLLVLFLNSIKINKKNKTRVPKFDLLYIASSLTEFIKIQKDFLNDWKEHLDWLVKFSNKHTDIKVGIKGREGDLLRQNKVFMNLIKNTKISFIDKFDDKKNDKLFKFNSLHSYDFAFESKVICTMHSTIGFEMIGHGKPCIFLDPGGRNTAFLPNEKFFNDVKVKSYEEFEKKFFDIINNKSNLNTINPEDYCINSNKTHEKIFNILYE